MSDIPTSGQSADPFAAVFAELTQHGGASRSAPRAIRDAYAAVAGELAAPTLFAADVLAQAQTALAGDAARMAAIEAEDRRLVCFRAQRATARRERDAIEWARCCNTLFSRNGRPVTQWTECLRCHKPLVFTPQIPDTETFTPYRYTRHAAYN